jgi:hypothetical protein
MQGTGFPGLSAAPPDHKDKNGKSSDRFDSWISHFAFYAARGKGIGLMGGNKESRPKAPGFPCSNKTNGLILSAATPKHWMV